MTPARAVRCEARDVALVGAAAVLIAVSRYALRAPVPDDYDAIGFVRALDQFDLARFQPHFPGYPVYVALGRCVHLVLRSPLAAADAVSALAAAVAGVALWRCVRAVATPRAAYCALGLYAGGALAWILGGAALSDGTAAALGLCAFAALAGSRGFGSGVLAALMLGARVSYFPLALSWAVLLVLYRRRETARALAGAALGTLAWAVPFVRVVGTAKLVALGRVHLVGHFTDWGGTIHTRPDLAARTAAFLRDWFYAGFAPRPWALAGLVGLCLLGFVSAIVSARRSDVPASSVSRRAWLAGGAVLFVPYAAWALLGQNVVEQPRHLLPLILMSQAALGCLLAPRPALALAAVATLLGANLPAMLARHRSEPAAAQMARFVATHYAPRDVGVFGGRSIRTLQYVAPEVPGYERTWLAEVDVTLERLNSLPHHILLTSEVEVDPRDPRRARRIKPGPTFCRDDVLDPTQACLQLSDYSIFEGRAP